MTMLYRSVSTDVDDDGGGNSGFIFYCVAKFVMDRYTFSYLNSSLYIRSKFDRRYLFVDHVNIVDNVSRCLVLCQQ